MKFLGGLLILCASVFVSYLYEKKQKAKINYISQIIDFVKYTKGQIEFFSTPYDKIIDNYSEKDDIKALINTKFKAYYEYFNIEEKKVIKSFFNTVGKGFINEEIALCDYTISALESANNKFKAENPNKIKIFRSMSLFLAISIIILLI